jgi:hypothetical protein
MRSSRPSSFPLLAWADVAAIAGVLLAVNVWVVWFVAQEHWLYRADEVSFWSSSIGLAHTLRADPWMAFVNLSRSVAHATLNLLPAFPIAVVLSVAGDSRLAYLLTVVDVYGSLVLLALVIAARRLGGTPDLGMGWSRAAIVATMLLAFSLWQPVVLGYLDLGGVAIALAILALYLCRAPEDLSPFQSVVIGFLTALLFLFRRWYGFWSLAFCALVATEALIEAACGRRKPVRSAIVIGAVAAGTLAAVALPVVLQVAATDFADKFAAFKVRHGAVAELSAPVKRFGLLLLIPALAGGVLLCVGPRAQRRLALFVGVQMALIFLLMRRIQDPDIHHFYLYLPGILCLVVVAAEQALARLPTVAPRLLLLGTLLASGGAVTMAVLSPAVASALHEWAPSPVAPRIRSDIPEVLRLLGYLDDRLREQPGYIYVFSSGGVISDQTLAFANLSAGVSYRSPVVVLQSSQLDRRDGFPCMLLKADYAVVPWPIDPPSRREEVQVILIPAESIARGRDIGQAFRQLPETFHLENRQTVLVYRRERELLTPEVEALSRLLRTAYPERPDIYEPCS